MRRALAVIAVLGVLTACGSDSPTQPTGNSIAGTWALQTANGSALPFVYSQQGANKAEVVSDVATVDAHGAYTQTTQIRLTINGQVTTQSVSDVGTYTLNGTALVLRSNDGSSVTASLSGNTFTLAIDGVAYVYKKQ
jgi:hypothetical protein